MNPVYWGRRITQEVALNIIVVKIGLALIAITGEETYKIYSKKVFDEDLSIDMGVDGIYEDINKELEREDAKDE